MKCFPDLGSCCRPISAAPSRQREEEEAISHYLASLRSSSSSSTRRHAKRMKRLGAAGSGGSQHWKPGLQAIREEGVGLDSDGNKIMNSQRKASPHNSKERYNNTSNIRRVSHLDENYYYSRSNSSPMFLPAFSPTPFMF
ncbi:hypothetical protein CCACVL1_24322 [Corchorus capsularis]|uniref:Uncharacterized protein n=1 Tax=Corchorus capsularis TaxID=210143 RepID=A0A1R3GQ27_COCAP|nr:hypothetical protein CCACVL1_24322 [Corchorus capsularis]